LHALPKIQKVLFDQYPWEEQNLPQEEYGKYDRALKARAFDIVRGFLPAGCSTNLAWWTSISHCAEHLGWLRCHPLDEVREIAKTTQTLLEILYPTSFEGRTVYPEREEYKEGDMCQSYYLQAASPYKTSFSTLLDEDLVRERGTYCFLSRPKGQELHYTVGEAGTVRYDALLDFASFRDQQRHRPVIQRQGLITADHGFHQWYLDNLPIDIREVAEKLLQEQLADIASIKTLNRFELQYLFPMGMNIPTRIVGPLGKVTYMVELRSQKTVHPTFSCKKNLHKYLKFNKMKFRCTLIQRLEFFH
jgi:hypothetical protein